MPESVKRLGSSGPTMGATVKRSSAGVVAMPGRLRGAARAAPRARQPQTVIFERSDLVGDLPCVTLMKARAVTVTVEPALVPAVTFSVWRNGALVSILTRFLPM